MLGSVQLAYQVLNFERVGDFQSQIVVTVSARRQPARGAETMASQAAERRAALRVDAVRDAQLHVALRAALPRRQAAQGAAQRER